MYTPSAAPGPSWHVQQMTYTMSKNQHAQLSININSTSYDCTTVPSTATVNRIGFYCMLLLLSTAVLCLTRLSLQTCQPEPAAASACLLRISAVLNQHLLLLLLRLLQEGVCYFFCSCCWCNHCYCCATTYLQPSTHIHSI